MRFRSSCTATLLLVLSSPLLLPLMSVTGSEEDTAAAASIDRIHSNDDHDNDDGKKVVLGVVVGSSSFSSATRGELFGPAKKDNDTTTASSSSVVVGEEEAEEAEAEEEDLVHVVERDKDDVMVAEGGHRDDNRADADDGDGVFLSQDGTASDRRIRDDRELRRMKKKKNKRKKKKNTKKRNGEVLDESLIPPRRQWECNYQNAQCCGKGCAKTDPPKICDGYCGSSTIQQIGMYYGMYASQGLVRRVFAANDKLGARDIWMYTKRPQQHPDALETARLVGLDRTSAWYAEIPGRQGMYAFTEWAKQHLRTTASPVFMGVINQFSRERDVDGDHYVTVTSGLKNGLNFNDNYSRKKISVTYGTYPDYADGGRCQALYCYADTMYGIAVHAPSGITRIAKNRSRLVRLQMISSVDTTTGKSLDVFEEPNWTCGSVTPSIMTFQAKPAYAQLLDPTQQWYVAVTFRATTAQEIRNAGSSIALFGGPPIECYPLASVTSSVQIQAPSNHAVYTRIVSSTDGGCS